MANWTALTFAYGSKLTSTQMTQLADNITAAFQGASGSPIFASGLVRPDMLTPYAVGSQYLLRTKTALTAGNSLHLVSETYLPKGGALKTSFSINQGSLTSPSMRARLYRNGTAVGTSALLDWLTLIIEDITSWSGGDRLQLYAVCSGAGRIDDALAFSVQVASTDFSLTTWVP